VNIELLKTFLRERLHTAELAEQAAGHIGVSLATMYRYKKSPESIPFGKLMALGKFLGFPIGVSAAWSRADVVAGERRRLELEVAVAAASGRRYVVSPSFPVTCELPDFTERMWDIDYGVRQNNRKLDYLELRQHRNVLYEKGEYESIELLIGSGYRDFLKGCGRFHGVGDDLRQQQLAAILRSLESSHIHRRIYLKHTPELPVFSCYSTDVAVIRVDDFTVEFSGAETTNELLDIFNDYYDNADIKTPGEVKEFLVGR